MISIRKRDVPRAFVPPPDKNAPASCVTLGKQKSLRVPSVNGVDTLAGQQETLLEPVGLSAPSFLVFEFPMISSDGDDSLTEQQEDPPVDVTPKAAVDFVFSPARKEVNTQTLHEKRNQEMAQVRADDMAAVISDQKRKNQEMTGLRAAEVGVNALDLDGAFTTLASVPSGPFVQQEKQKIKIKEKLEKCVKEKLMEFCDVLGIPIAIENKKEEIIVELVNFFVEPAAPTIELFAEKEQLCQGTKCKTGDSIDTSVKTFSRKNITDNGKEKKEKEKATNLKQPSSKGKCGRKVMKGKDKPGKEKLQPSDAELRKRIRLILVEVDINTTTFSDILKKLCHLPTMWTGKYYSDLMPRKSSIKLMIKDELTKLADEAEDSDEDEEEKEEGKTEKKRRVIL